jgi:hypothetical protein
MPGVQAALCQRIDHMRSPIERVVIYIHTVHILVPRWKVCGPGYQKHITDCEVANAKESKSDGKARIEIQFPGTKCLKQLDKLYPDNIVSRFDLAIDFIISDEEAAAALNADLRLLITQPWHGNNIAVDYITTSYLRQPWRGRNVALYSDKKAIKVINSPTVHLELRFEGAEACKTCDIKHAADLLTLDIADCIKRNIKLTIIDREKAHRLFLRDACNIANNHIRQHRRKNRLSFPDKSDPHSILKGTENEHCRAALSRLYTPISIPEDLPESIPDALPDWLSDEVPAQTWCELSPYIRKAAISLPFALLLKGLECQFLPHPSKYLKQKTFSSPYADSSSPSHYYD